MKTSLSLLKSFWNESIRVAKKDPSTLILLGLLSLANVFALTAAYQHMYNPDIIINPKRRRKLFRDEYEQSEGKKLVSNRKRFFRYLKSLEKRNQ